MRRRRAQPRPPLPDGPWQGVRRATCLELALATLLIVSAAVLLAIVMQLNMEVR